MQRGQEGKVYCIKNTTRNEQKLAKQMRYEGWRFFAKTRRANETKWNADLADYWSITCLYAGHGDLRIESNS